MAQNISQDKAVLRKEFADVRANLSNSAAMSAAKAVAANFLAYVRLEPNSVVGCYHSIKNELDVNVLMEKLLAMGHVTALPVVEAQDKPLIFRQWKEGDELEKSQFFNVMEPTLAYPETVPNVLVVPMLAFSREGYRLGYGGGFYDRTIADLRVRVPDMKIIGCAFDNQETDALPVDDHDQKLDFIVSEKGVLSF